MTSEPDAPLEGGSDTVTLPGATAVFVCSRGPIHPERCTVCKKGLGSQLCDGPGTSARKTCDRRVCRECSWSPETGGDLCSPCVIAMYPADVKGWQPRWSGILAPCFKKCGRESKVVLSKLGGTAVTETSVPACAECCRSAA